MANCFTADLSHIATYMGRNNLLEINGFCDLKHLTPWPHGRGVTNGCQISYAPAEMLFKINEITRFLKFEIKKIGMETSKIS